mmetsp:Transcript_62789/g.132603  ORF Transcript_62789/g.132603 Transcript_62789/m.132603 type:complete len:291 (+) Transcript_62789:1019-1891(+)
MTPTSITAKSKRRRTVMRLGMPMTRPTNMLARSLKKGDLTSFITLMIRASLRVRNMTAVRSGFDTWSPWKAASMVTSIEESTAIRKSDTFHRQASPRKYLRQPSTPILIAASARNTKEQKASKQSQPTCSGSKSELNPSKNTFKQTIADTNQFNLRIIVFRRTGMSMVRERLGVKRGTAPETTSSTVCICRAATRSQNGGLRNWRLLRPGRPRSTKKSTNLMRGTQPGPAADLKVGGREIDARGVIRDQPNPFTSSMKSSKYSRLSLFPTRSSRATCISAAVIKCESAAS